MFGYGGSLGTGYGFLVCFMSVLIANILNGLRKDMESRADYWGNISGSAVEFMG